MSYNVLDVNSAIENCQFDEFKNTVKSGALDVNKKYEEEGFTALHYVLANPTLDVTQKIQWIKLLASLGADLNMKYGTTPQNNVSPLFVAMRREDTEIIKCLVEQGANLHVVNDTGSTLLHYASDLGNIESIKCLVSLGIDVNARNNNGFTPIFGAADQGEIESIQCLVKLGADVNARSNDGFTPIFMAVSANNIQSLKCLKALGADLNAKTNDGRTALTVGVGLGDVPEAVEWLKNNNPIAMAEAQAKQREIEQKREREEKERRKARLKCILLPAVIGLVAGAGFGIGFALLMPVFPAIMDSISENIYYPVMLLTPVIAAIVVLAKKGGCGLSIGVFFGVWGLYLVFVVLYTLLYDVVRDDNYNTISALFSGATAIVGAGIGTLIGVKRG